MTDVITAAGRTLWEVSVTRESFLGFFILAETEDQANEDAREMAASMFASDWEVVDEFYSAHAVKSEPRDNEMVWTGGADGQDVFWKEAKLLPNNEKHQEIPGQESLLS